MFKEWVKGGYGPGLREVLDGREQSATDKDGYRINHGVQGPGSWIWDASKAPSHWRWFFSWEYKWEDEEIGGGWVQGLLRCHHVSEIY